MALTKSQTSKSTWVIAAAVATAEIGLLSYKYFKGDINGNMFLKRSGIKIAACSVGAIGSCVGWSSGAAIGTVICPGLGTIIGGLVGGVVGGFTF